MYVIETVGTIGSNMVKAFKVFGAKMSYFEKSSSSHDNDESDIDSNVSSFQSKEQK